MANENLETNEKLEQIEANALEINDDVTPLELNEQEAVEASEMDEQPSFEMSSCTCSGGCGNNYSYGNCTCSGNCGNNYHK